MGLFTEPNRRGAAPWLPVALLLTGVGWGSNQTTPMLNRRTADAFPT